MADWHPNCYQRAVAFVTAPDGRLLVFDHLDVDAGTQVPGGGIHNGEAPQVAVLRELAEESGIRDAVVVRKLGEAWHRSESENVPVGLEEQIHHVFHLALPQQSVEESWIWEERSEGDSVEHRFSFRWVSLSDAKDLLWPSQSMWVAALGVSLRDR